MYNTYWVRFSRGRVTFDNAIKNTRTLLKAAREAGVRRVVHISITSPSEESSLPYFRDKAVVKSAVVGSGLTYAIVRPTEIFGPEDILTNNIAFMLLRFPVIAIPGSGEYPIQPVFVEDVAEIAVDTGHRDENLVLDAVRPEIYTFTVMVRLMAETGQLLGVIVPAVARVDAVTPVDINLEPDFQEESFRGYCRSANRIYLIRLIPPIILFACSLSTLRGMKALWGAR